MIRILESGDTAIANVIKKEFPDQAVYEERVREILQNVRERGDEALIEYTARFDRAQLAPETLRVSTAEIEEAYKETDDEFLTAIRRARDNIAVYHRKQLHTSWMETSEDGTILGQLIRPVERAGIYVPGGTANYPSSVLMNAVPAGVAGVREIVMVAPPGSDGRLQASTLVAAAEAGVTEIYKLGGAQAVAALAYGTATVKPVDLITGPGNIYVTLAKKMVYGVVNIDMLAGPSEILVIADDTADPVYVAADLLSQAEHDVLASAVLLTPSRVLAEAVREEIRRQVGYLSRKEIMTASLRDYSAIIVTRDLAEAVELANSYAPEHLELAVAAPFDMLGKIRNAGSIFMGHYTPEPVGDYFAGPNHVLPTGGTARFYSPLNVDTFMKKSGLIAYSPDRLKKHGADIIKLAETEGLDAHANSVRVRLGK
ncbi:histidinol dehydrogenase [Phosphitispora fastidiosa]|uniref:histidinol dehydrogenase n=1 Tax=Phosphitispora fastidiosa TaxID=2837202 RepID=UPI001E425EF4|nr:histidinol dehydrogenase [Phosphitispora fastidiosa]MBU7008531.1 histidinol dehydrogenase [Phosphitispora fastidiosa]